MKIELASMEYWIDCYYEEAQLYCFSLNIDGKTGWRLPTYDEWGDHHELYGWFRGKIAGNRAKFTIIPVRDITND